MAGRLERQRSFELGRGPAYTVMLSADGRLTVVGTEEGIVIMDRQGRELLAYPSRSIPMPVRRLVATPDLQEIYLAARQGWLLRLDVEPLSDGALKHHINKLYEAPNDLNGLALASQAGILALGHLSSTLALLRSDGKLLWQQIQVGTAGEGQIWSVALDASGSLLYAGSAGAGTNLLVALDAGSSVVHAQIYLDSRATAVSTALSDAGVIVALVDSYYGGHLQAYSPDLDLIWEQTFDEPVTAMAIDSEHPLVAVAVGYEGRVLLLDAANGESLAEEYRITSVVNGLSLVQGRLLAAAAEDGSMTLLRYLS